MTKKVKSRLLKAALTFTVVCVLAAPSMTIRADEITGNEEDIQLIQTAVQVQNKVPSAEAETGGGGETVPPAESDPQGYAMQLQDIRQILQIQLEEVQDQILILTQLQETAVINAAQLQLLGQLQELEQSQLQQIAMTDAQIEAFMGIKAAEEELPAGPEIIFVGDSRFVQMHNAVGDNGFVWIAKSSQGYKWFASEAVPQIDEVVGRGSKIIINLGVNDVANVSAYAELVNKKAAEWIQKGATVYYSSVNPVENGKYVTKSMVSNFNKKLQARLIPDIRWIDSHTYLQSAGYSLTDGVHFSNGTYKNLYNYYLSALNADV